MTCKHCKGPTPKPSSNGHIRIYCSDLCRKLGRKNTKQCDICDNDFVGRGLRCSDKCKEIFVMNIMNKDKDPATMPTCQICGLISENLSTHISRTHNMKSDEYKSKYNMPLTSGAWSKKISEANAKEKNPGWKHGGKLSSWSKTSKYFSEESKEKAKENRKGKRSSDFDYWLNKCDGDEAEARKLYKDRQTTNGLPFYIDKYGKEEGPIKFKERIKQWQTSLDALSPEKKAEIYAKKIAGFKKSRGNKSGISEKMFNELSEFYSGILYGNNEKTFKRSNDRLVNVDGFCPKTNRIIEFYGDYWHGNLSRYKLTDQIHTGRGAYTSVKDKHQLDKNRISEILQHNNVADILIIWEKDYRKDPEETVKRCLKFLRE